MIQLGRANNYFLNAEKVPEAARLALQRTLLTKEMGGLFPQGADLRQVRKVLDIACGPGTWPLEVASHNPQMEVVGIDISQTMLSYARDLAELSALKNVRFLTMDATKPLLFPDASFDWINLSWIAGFMTRQDWQPLIQECYRLLRPGGVIHLFEQELPISNSPACETMVGIFSHAFAFTGRSISPHGRVLGTTAILGSLLRWVGCTNIQDQVYTIDYSFGTEEAEQWVQNIEAVMEFAKPFLMRYGRITGEEFDKLYEQATLEMRLEDFCVLLLCRSTRGRKPGRAHPRHVALQLERTRQSNRKEPADACL